jgi:exodeoxyribonuclease V gamma subunit
MNMPGLYLNTGNSLDRLAESLTCLVKENHTGNPFEPETILVQSRGMQRWLSMRIAESLGVVSNFRFPFPNTFIHELFGCSLGVKPDKGYSPERLSFRIMGIIETIMDDALFATLKKYFSDDKSCLKLVQLSRQIADAFDQYLVFRPEIILGWDSGKRFFAGSSEEITEEWQAVIWNRITEDLGAHAARLRQDFFSKLEEGKPDGLPGRISIFGISHLPYFHLEILRAFSTVADVHLFLLNPCRQFWMDIENEKNIIKKKRKAGRTAEALHLEIGNSLLASMGKQGSDFLGYLYGIDEIIAGESDPWEMPGEGSVLGLIKKDILELRNGPESGKYAIDPGDESIAIHSCHSPMREVEVLRDNLLDMFENDPALKPEEIVVMSPDISMYAPYVQAVFGSVASSRTHIPFSVSDTQPIEKPLTDGFFSLLGLSDKRFRASQILGLLDEPSVRGRYEISDDDIGKIREWIGATCIRWGIDAANREDLGLEPTDNNTWRSGLDRLLLGYAMPDNMFFRDILAVAGIEGDSAQVLGKFLTFTEKAFDYGLKLSRNRNLKDWSDLLLKMIDDMLDTQDHLQGALSLRDAVSNLVSEHGYNGEPGIQAVTHLIKTSIMEPAIGRFLTKGITFCSLLPMRSIPMKVVCLLGMNDDAYPRQNISTGFNLISRTPRKGDRSLRDDDRYLFLESVISAREKLYISYTGQDIRDNSKRPPSVLVSELLDYIKTSFDITGVSEDELKDKAFEERFITKHRLQGFSPKYFTGTSERLFSYSESDCETAKALRQTPRNSLKPFISSLIKHDPAEFRDLSVETLIEFFDSPVRFFLRRRLGITLRRGIDEIDDRETIVPDDLEKYLISQQIADCMVKDIDPLPTLKAQGMLPHASIGLALYDELSSLTKRLMSVVKGLNGHGSEEITGFEVSSGDYTVSGNFSLYDGSLVLFRPSSISAKQIVRAWLWHVLYNLQGKGGITQLAGFIKKEKDKVPAVMRFEPLSYPQSTLDNILGLFSHGLARPLHFFPNLSKAYAEGIIEKDEDKVIKGLIRDWAGNGFSKGEKEMDPHYLIYPGETCPIDDNFKWASSLFFDELLQNSVLES